MTPDVVLYTRKQCGLCDEAAAQLRALEAPLEFRLVERDIDEDAALRERFDESVPVVAVGDGIIARAPIEPGALREALVIALAAVRGGAE
jgi:hypothetical protein